MNSLLYAVLGVVWAASPAGAALTAEQQRILDETRQVAVTLSNSLPNFICIEEIRRNVDWVSKGYDIPLDSIEAQVTYFDGRESYKLIGRRSRLKYLPGAISVGEFASTLRTIFDPAVKTEFEWKGEATIRERPVSVFAYRVDAKKSRLKLVAFAHLATAGFHGTLSIDQTRKVLALSLESQGPKGFPIRDSFTVDYNLVNFAGRQYLMPISAEVRIIENRAAKAAVSPLPNTPVGSLPPPGSIRAPDSMSSSCTDCVAERIPESRHPKPILTRYRNLIEFREYQKFTAQSKRALRESSDGVSSWELSRRADRFAAS